MEESSNRFKDGAGQDGDPGTSTGSAGSAKAPRSPPTYWLTRFLILRLLGGVYLVAFLVLVNQGLPLIGSDGLLPADLLIERIAGQLGSRFAAFLQLPSIFWLGWDDRFFQAAAWAGVILSLPVLFGYANGVLLLLLWGLYMSFVHVGQLWYSYGWEIQLLETGFLAVFLCPLLDGRPFPKLGPPVLVIWLFRWLGFRIMFGAGMIKIRGDPCWRDLTCLIYHYQTQPIPNPFSRTLYFMPVWFHKFGVLWNHFIELLVPWFVFWPRIARHTAGVLLVSFQFILILSGNLSFLNWLTIVPMLACFDDALLCRVAPKWLGMKAAAAAAAAGECYPRVAIALASVVGLLSIAPVVNIISPRQVMNTSFDRLHLVNTYGAFGSVGRERREIVFEGTSDAVIQGDTVWKEYEFKCKPGDPMRRPCWISPYHYRLDWQIWFAAMATPRQYPWTVHFVWKLLHNDPGTLSLLGNNPFPDKPPRYIRARLYRYEFAPPGDSSGAWWRRALIGEWLPALSAGDAALREFLAAYGWIESPSPSAKRAGGGEDGPVR